MSDLSAASYCQDKKCDTGFSPMIMIILLLCLCGGDGGLFGGSCQNNGCNNGNSCGCGCGLDGILPMILLFSLCGGF